MNDPATCDHDFRRVFASDITRQITGEEGPVVAVVCCWCGRSPLYLNVGSLGQMGDWPTSHRITAFYLDDREGPSVEFAVKG